MKTPQSKINRIEARWRQIYTLIDFAFGLTGLLAFLAAIWCLFLLGHGLGI